MRLIFLKNYTPRNPCKTICIAIFVLKAGSECSFTTYKFCFLADFRLELTASLTFFRGPLIRSI